VLVVGPSNTVLDDFFDQDAIGRLATIEKLAPRAGDRRLPQARPQRRHRPGDLRPLRTRTRPTCRWRTPTSSARCRALASQQGDLPAAGGHPEQGTHPLLRFLTTLSEVRVSEAFEFDVRRDLDPEAAKQLKPDQGRSPTRATRSPVACCRP